MKTFDKTYPLLKDMYEDSYFPDFLVAKIEEELKKLITLLESGERDIDTIQEKLDEIVLAINDLEEEFEAHDSEIETVARDSIGTSIEAILTWFEIPIEIEEAIREREW